MAKYYIGNPPEKDDFGGKITDEFIDAPTQMGPWANMNPANWRRYRRSKKLGMGLGQRYKLQEDGRWLKVEG